MQQGSSLLMYNFNTSYETCGMNMLLKIILLHKYFSIVFPNIYGTSRIVGSRVLSLLICPYVLLPIQTALKLVMLLLRRVQGRLRMSLC